MYCGYCGKKNSDQMLFCVFCGKPLEVPEQGEEDVRKSRYAPPEDVAQAPSQEGVDGDEERNFAPDAAEEAPEAQEDAASGFEVFDEPDAQVPEDGDMPESSEQRLEEQGAEEQVPDLPLEPAIRIKTNYRSRRRPKHNPRPEDDSENIHLFDAEDRPILREPVKLRAQRPPELRRNLRDEENQADALEMEPSADPLAKPILKSPVQLKGTRPPQLRRTDTPVRLTNAQNRRPINTAIPKHGDETDDLFLDSEGFEEDYEEEYDLEDDSGGYLYEEPERKGFFYRHIRGIVTLTLLALTVIIVGGWLTFGSGQRLLGQLYLSSNSNTYIALGEEAEAQGDYEQAGAYFMKALKISPAVDTAIYASNAYVQANNIGKAAEALEILLSIAPDYTEAYVTLKSFYPDVSTRPARINELIQQGYLRTGDERLKEE